MNQLRTHASSAWAQAEKIPCHVVRGDTKDGLFWNGRNLQKHQLRVCHFASMSIWLISGAGDTGQLESRKLSFKLFSDKQLNPIAGFWYDANVSSISNLLGPAALEGIVSVRIKVEWISWNVILKAPSLIAFYSEAFLQHWRMHPYIISAPNLLINYTVTAYMCLTLLIPVVNGTLSQILETFNKFQFYIWLQCLKNSTGHGGLWSSKNLLRLLSSISSFRDWRRARASRTFCMLLLMIWEELGAACAQA